MIFLFWLIKNNNFLWYNLIHGKYFTCAIYAINYADVPNQTELFCEITKNT